MGARRSEEKNRSPSPSKPKVKLIKTENDSGSKAYTSPSRIAKIFRNMITTDALCQLSAMEEGTPADVKRVIPKANVEQICKMCELWEESRRYEHGKRRRPISPKRDRQRSSKRRRRRQPKEQRRAKPVKIHKLKEEKTVQEVKAQESVFPVPTPKKSE